MDLFSQRFKDLKDINNLTYQDIANYLELKDRTVKSYSSGKIKPTFYGIIKLCKLFNVSADYLLGLSDDPKRY